MSTDDFAGWLALQTNLALKGIIGIKAMSAIAEIVDNKEDVKFYKVIPPLCAEIGYSLFYPEYLISLCKQMGRIWSLA